MLFDKDGFYLINDKNDNYDFAVEIMNGSLDLRPQSKNKSMSNEKLYNLEEALEKGNAFPDLYEPYKSYRPYELKAGNAREKALLEIQMLEFSINDLNLYLDLNPDDEKKYRLFKTYVEECKKKKEMYTRVYGPLTIDDLTDDYEWSKGVWPWEEGAM